MPLDGSLEGVDRGGHVHPPLRAAEPVRPWLSIKIQHMHILLCIYIS